MPELPEVEQVKNSLRKYIVGQTIEQVEVRLPRLIQHPSAADFEQQCRGLVIEDIERRGKYLRLVLSQGYALVVHLRMTGALLAVAKTKPEPEHAHVCFTLTGKYNLWFSDIRTFGTLYLLQGDSYQIKGLETLGPEPNTPELTAAYLYACCQKRKAPIKNVILDQTVIAGLGNIYADEALFTAGLLPVRPSNSLTQKQVSVLVEAVNKVIAQGIANHGTTFRNYQDAEGKQGSNQNYLLAYGRKGQPCKQCGTLLVGTKVGGRGTSYCPHCQS